MLTFFTVLKQESPEKTNTQQLFNTIFMKIAEYNNSNCSKFNTAAKQLHFDNFHRSIMDNFTNVWIRLNIVWINVLL